MANAILLARLRVMRYAFRMKIENINVAVPTELAHRLKHWMAESPDATIDVLTDAVNKLDGNVLSSRESLSKTQLLIERFRKHRGAIKDTNLCDLLDARREGILD